MKIYVTHCYLHVSLICPLDVCLNASCCEPKYQAKIDLKGETRYRKSRLSGRSCCYSLWTEVLNSCVQLGQVQSSSGWRSHCNREIGMIDGVISHPPICYMLCGQFELMEGFNVKQAPQHLHEPVVFAVAAVNDCYYTAGLSQ
jgi:hypothetical protein